MTPEQQVSPDHTQCGKEEEIQREASITSLHQTYGLSITNQQQRCSVYTKCVHNQVQFEERALPSVTQHLSRDDCLEYTRKVDVYIYLQGGQHTVQ